MSDAFAAQTHEYVWQLTGHGIYSACMLYANCVVEVLTYCRCIVPGCVYAAPSTTLLLCTPAAVKGLAEPDMKAGNKKYSEADWNEASTVEEEPYLYSKVSFL